MRIGLSMPLPAYTIDPAFMGCAAERLGFDSIWYRASGRARRKRQPIPRNGGAIPWTYSHFTELTALARAR
jgi:hypothetical protein